MAFTTRRVVRRSNKLEASKRPKGYAWKLKNAEGREYAPWLTNQVDDDATAVSRKKRDARQRRDHDAMEKDGTLGFDGIESELGGGVRLHARVVDAPQADATKEGSVELGWTGLDTEGDFTLEKRHVGRGDWETISRHAHPPFVDDHAEHGESLYRVKQQGHVVSQVGVLVETAKERQSNNMVLGILGAGLAALIAAGVAIDSIPKV